MTANITHKGDPREPDLSFVSARHKVRWAEEHIKAFVRAQAQVIDEYTKTGALHFDNNTGRLIMQNQEIAPWVSLTAGDIIFNLRSALDCCWMGLKRAADAKADKATLPRKDTRKEVETTLAKASMEAVFQGTDSFILDKVKPYRDGNEAIWFAGKVDNWNKHNMLVVTLQRSSINEFTGTVHNPSGGGIHIVMENVKNIGPGNFSMGFGAPGSILTYHGKPNISVDVILVMREPVDERPLLPFLWAALKETNEAVELFVSTFGKKGS